MHLLSSSILNCHSDTVGVFFFIPKNSEHTKLVINFISSLAQPIQFKALMQVLQRPYDDPADNNPDFWQKCPTNKSLLAQTKIYESLLAVKRKGNKKESKFRTFRLIDDILICFSVSYPHIPRSCMVLLLIIAQKSTSDQGA